MNHTVIDSAELAELRNQRDDCLKALQTIVQTIRQQKCSINQFPAQETIVNVATAAINRATK